MLFVGAIVNSRVARAGCSGDKSEGQGLRLRVPDEHLQIGAPRRDSYSLLNVAPTGVTVIDARSRSCRQGNDSVVRPYVLLCLPASYRSTALTVLPRANLRELKGRPERELGESQQSVAGLFPIVQGSKFASGYRGP